MIGVVFDLDGTLIESAQAIQGIGSRLLAERGQAPLSLAEAKSFVGSGAAKFVERAFAARGLEGDQALADGVARFEALYAEADPSENPPMPGADDAMRALAEAGFPLGLCTNKPGAPTVSILDVLGWTPLLPVVIAGDTLPVKKPDPEPLLEARRRLGCERILFVGDSEVDAETAERAGVPLLLYAHGYRKSPLEALPHKAAFSDFAELPEMVRGLTPG